jgi:hypothetical protein
MDSFLAWFVVLAPTLFAFGIELVSEQIRKSRKWRVGVIVFGLSLSGTTYWQQSRERSASAKDRQKAIQETSAETSKLVTASVSDLYSHKISEQNMQIADLQAELKAQSRNIDTIKGSDIISGKKPVKVEVTNPSIVQSPPVPMLSGIRIASQKQIPSDDSNLPFGLEVVIQTDTDIVPVKLAVLCDGPIGKGDAALEGGGAYTMIIHGLAEGNDRIFITKWETPAWTPQRPILVRLFSKAAIRAIGLSRNVF